MQDSLQNTAAVVTGASSGIGKAVCHMLLREGFEVFGFGRAFLPEAECPEERNGEAFSKECGRFHKITCDLLDTDRLEEAVKKIRRSAKITLLVNNAGTAYYGLHEELSPGKIREMVRTNLELPMILTNLLLRDLKKNQGDIINISSVTAEAASPHGCAYAATKAGLSSFSGSLFAEVRKRGVRVINIQPDMTETALYRHADFETDEEIFAKLLPEEVAEAVRFAVTRREGMVVTELTVRPQFHRIRRK